MSDLVIAPMTRERALEVVGAIRSHLENARTLLYELYTGKGWEALGYGSWRECVAAEFGQSQSQLYRELAAAHIEANLPDFAHVRKSERSLRPLAQLPADLQPLAYQIAVEQAEQDGTQTPTARHTSAVAEVLGEIVASGGFVSLDGLATPLSASLTEHQLETLMRQREYIREAVAQKRGVHVVSVECFLAEQELSMNYRELRVYVNTADGEMLLAAVNAGAYLTLTARKKDTR